MQKQAVCTASFSNAVAERIERTKHGASLPEGLKCRNSNLPFAGEAPVRQDRLNVPVHRSYKLLSAIRVRDRF